MSENSEKSIKKCFRLLIRKFRHLQHELNAKLRNERFIHKKLILACQKMSACNYACCKPANNLTNLINDLRFSIITYIRSHCHEIEFYSVNAIAIAIEIEFFFIDRQYHRDKSQQRYFESFQQRYLKSFSFRPFLSFTNELLISYEKN